MKAFVLIAVLFLSACCGGHRSSDLISYKVVSYKVGPNDAGADICHITARNDLSTLHAVHVLPCEVDVGEEVVKATGTDYLYRAEDTARNHPMFITDETKN
jgi:hypothetical protein